VKVKVEQWLPEARESEAGKRRNYMNGYDVKSQSDGIKTF
jgi:hypothetical protein